MYATGEHLPDQTCLTSYIRSIAKPLNYTCNMQLSPSFLSCLNHPIGERSFRNQTKDQNHWSGNKPLLNEIQKIYKSWL